MKKANKLEKILVGFALLLLGAIVIGGSSYIGYLFVNMDKLFLISIVTIVIVGIITLLALVLFIFVSYKLGDWVLS